MNKIKRKFANPLYWLTRIWNSLVGIVITDYFFNRWFGTKFYSVNEFFFTWVISIIISFIINLAMEAIWRD